VLLGDIGCVSRRDGHAAPERAVCSYSRAIGIAGTVLAFSNKGVEGVLKEALSDVAVSSVTGLGRQKLVGVLFTGDRAGGFQSRRLNLGGSGWSWARARSQ
jgi:hypothetical protein